MMPLTKGLNSSLGISVAEGTVASGALQATKDIVITKIISKACMTLVVFRCISFSPLKIKYLDTIRTVKLQLAEAWLP